MARKVRNLNKKEDPFVGETFSVLRTELSSKMGGNVKFAVALGIEHFAPGEKDRAKVLAITRAVTPEQLREAISAIVAVAAEKAKAGDEGDGEVREDFRDFHTDEANQRFAAGEWKGMFRVSDEIAHVKALGYSRNNLAGPEIVEGFVALERGRKEELKKLLDERAEPDAAPAACQAARHRGGPVTFQPQVRYVLRWEDGKPVGRKTHEGGGGEIPSGDFLLAKDVAWNIISSAKAEEMKAQDPMVLAADSYRLYCRDCQAAANRDADERLIFRSLAGVRAVLEAMKLRASGVSEARDFESHASKGRRPLLPGAGSRKRGAPVEGGFSNHPRAKGRK